MPQEFEKISHLFWHYWVKTTVLSKQVGDFFQILWPSHNVWTLRNLGTRHLFSYLWFKLSGPVISKALLISFSKLKESIKEKFIPLPHKKNPIIFNKLFLTYHIVQIGAILRIFCSIGNLSWTYVNSNNTVKIWSQNPGTLTTAATNVYSKKLIKQSKKEICMWKNKEN